MSTTIFIAVQCYQCSTMQVKQQKKSSNKWTCVVCNQKQSVRKVFAQGFMARDVRKFVQSFNMSRQFAEQHSVDETLAPLPEDTNNQPPSNHKKRRTDWSEYIDPEDNRDDQVKDEQEYVFDSMIVTELPKALFEKSKLNNSSGLGTEDSEKGYRPVFSKRNSNKHDKEPRKYQPTTVNRAFKWSDSTAQDEREISADMEPGKHLPTTSKGASKWRTYATQENEDDFRESRRFCSTSADGTSKRSDSIIQDKNEDLADKVPWQCQPRTLKVASKWDNYITEDDDDDDLQLKSRGEIAHHMGQWDDDAVFEATLYDEKVEEDIHPDFQ